MMAIFYSVYSGMSPATNSEASFKTIIFFTSFSIFVRDGFFSAGQWVFSYQYFDISQKMPFVFDKKPMPESIQKRNSFINALMFTLNLLVPAAEATTYYIYKVTKYYHCSSFPCKPYETWKKVQVLMRYSVAAL